MRYLSVLGVLSAFILVAYANSQPKYTVGYQANDPNVFGWVICGGIIVFFFYWIKFSEWAGDGQSPPGFRPRPVRHFTTWVRYLGWNSLYGLMMAGAYCAVVFFPDIISEFVQLFAPVLKSVSLDNLFANLPVQASAGDGALQMVPYAVMLTTAIWSGMPPFSRFEERIRLRWQENASIPSQARQLMEAFEENIGGENNFNADPKIITEVMRRLDNHALGENDFSDSGQSVWYLYARAAYLFHMLEKHNRSPLFSRLVEQYSNEFNDLEKEMVNLHGLVEQRIGDILDLCEHDEVDVHSLATRDFFEDGEVKKTLPTLKTAEQWLQEYLSNASKAERAYFKGQKNHLIETLNSISREITQLIVCGVLAVGRSIGKREELLKSFGLKNTDRIVPPLDLVTLVWVALIAVGIMFFCSTLYLIVQRAFGHQGEMIPQNMTEVLVWSMVAGLMHLSAICGGYVVQRAMENDRKSIRSGGYKVLPFRAQVAEAVWSALFGISLNVYILGAFAALHDDFSSLSHTWWWAIVPGVTAFFAALYTQNIQRTDREFHSLLLWQGLTTGAMAFFIFIIVNFQNLFPDEKIGSSLELLPYIIFVFYVVMTTTIIGRALGKSLNIWVMAERYTGTANKRTGLRKNYLYKKGTWRSVNGDMKVRAVCVSESGAELRTPQPLPVNSEGGFKMTGDQIRRAVVLRNDQVDECRIFVKFCNEQESDLQIV